MTTAPAQANDEAVLAAHRKLVQDTTLQFDLVRPVDQSPPEPPSWLHGIGEALNAIAPLLTWVFWGGVALIVAFIIFFLVREVLRVRFGLKPKATRKMEQEPEWRPTAQAARTLLADADELAARGLYAEAAHLLLLRSIDDLDSRRPQTVRPAQTARDISTLSALPEAARPAFGKIARVVELSLFGGSEVDAAVFADCRRAYEDFALPSGWSR
jgi:hypothetical protein